MRTTTCGYCRDLFRPKRSTAVYCSDACRKAASRKRGLPTNGAGQRPGEAVEGLVTLTPSDTPPLAPVTLTEPISRAPDSALWRWYERLDGSCDLYCDTERTTRHVARVVWRNGSYRLDKPSGLTSEVWADCRAAWDAVRSLVR